MRSIAAWVRHPGQELNVSYYGYNVLYFAENIVRMWHGSSTPSRLTLIDRMRDTQGRIAAQLARQSDSHLSENSTTDSQRIDSTLSTSKQEPVPSKGIKFLQWNCDHVFSLLGDYSGWFLDMATQQRPSVLTQLILDISQLSVHGLASVQNILHRSSLENLHIVCTCVNPSLSDSVARILTSLLWPTLISLVLSGFHIDAWIRIWMRPHSNPFRPNTQSDCGQQLLSLHLQGTESTVQLLSHISALFVHGLVYWNPSVEVHLENVELGGDFF